MLVFVEGVNQSNWRKTLRALQQDENQQQSQLTYDTLARGERCHHCANPAPHLKPQPQEYNVPRYKYTLFGDNRSGDVTKEKLCKTNTSRKGPGY